MNIDGLSPETESNIIGEKYTPKQPELSENEKKGLLYGSLIAAGIHAAAGGLRGGLGEAAIQGLSGGFTSYAGGQEELFKQKKNEEASRIQWQRQEDLVKNREASDAYRNLKETELNYWKGQNFGLNQDKFDLMLQKFLADAKRKDDKAATTPDFGDKELIKKTMTEMPKLKKDAISGFNSSNQIDIAMGFLTKGVTGKGGQLKSFFAPYAEMVGMPVENMDEAQTFQLLTRAIIGPMRLDIVGPGPVSEWEQKLMQQISGSGGASKQAAAQLLRHWKTLSQSKIDNYNNTLEGFSEIYPNVKRVYKPMLQQNKQPQQNAIQEKGQQPQQPQKRFNVIEVK